MASETRTAIAASAASNGGTTRCSAAKTVLWPKQSACRMARSTTDTPAHPYGRLAFTSRSSTASSWRQRRRESFRTQASPSEEPNTSTSCPSRTGTATVDGRRTSRQLQCSLITASTGASTPEPSARCADGIAGVPYVAGNENFQQGAFLRPGPGDAYVYSFGTPSGRGGPAFVSRVPQGSVPDLTKYEYWSSDSEFLGPEQSGGRHAGHAGPGRRDVGPIQHLSQAIPGALQQRWERRRGKDCAGSARTVESEQLLVRSWHIPGGIYAPYLHPWSTGKELYFNLSLWSAYNVMLMKSVLP